MAELLGKTQNPKVLGTDTHSVTLTDSTIRKNVISAIQIVTLGVSFERPQDVHIEMLTKRIICYPPIPPPPLKTTPPPAPAPAPPPPPPSPRDCRTPDTGSATIITRQVSPVRKDRHRGSQSSLFDHPARTRIRNESMREGVTGVDTVRVDRKDVSRILTADHLP